MTPAARAREAALSVEAKKHALRQQQDGCWIMTLRVHQNDMPEAIMKAAMGTRYMLAMVEIGDDEQPVSQRAQSPIPGAGIQPAPAQPSVPAEPVRADRERRKFDEMAPSQQAGILCNEPAFAKFLVEKFNKEIVLAGYSVPAAVRIICDVNSRADIKPGDAKWSALVLSYRLWQREPEYVG